MKAWIVNDDVKKKKGLPLLSKSNWGQHSFIHSFMMMIVMVDITKSYVRVIIPWTFQVYVCIYL